MTRSPFLSLALIALSSAPLFAQADKPATSKPMPADARTMDIEMLDNGKLRMTLEVDKIEVESPYGKLSIPVEEIVSIEFAPRLTESQAKRLDAALFSLGSSDFSQREEAERELIALGEKAYAPLVKATKHADLEVAQRANELVKRLRDSLPEDRQEVREHDVVETGHSRFTGRVTTKTLAVKTAQFGTQQLQLTDVRNVRSLHAPPSETEIADVQADPGNLLGLHGSIGKTFAFKVTGRAGGSVYGTGVYTTDSSLAAAAVHAGVLKAGETGIVKVTMIASPPAFAASTQNGITSYAWGAYPAAYQIHVPKGKK